MTALRSERSRTAILTAARNRFASEGYQRTTIRAVAADVGIDPSMVMRYFGNKEALFAAAADFDLALPDLAGADPERLGELAVRHFLDRWEHADDSLRILLASAATHPAAAERMRDILRRQLAPMVAATGPHPPAVAAERAGLVATQMLGFALCRYVILLPPVVDLTPEDAVAWLAPTIQRYLSGPPVSG